MKYKNYKDSGIEWIGEVPNHWEVRRLRFACEFRNGYTPSKANPNFWNEGTIPWYRMEDIREKGRFLKEAKQYITEEAVKGNGLFEAGSFILATTATIGEHAVLIVDSLANQQFTNLKIRKSLAHKLNGDFFFYYLFVIDDYCKSTTRTATFPAVNMDDLKNFRVTLPPFSEQQAIATYLDEKCSKINRAIDVQKKKIDLLGELKQTIITNAVTKGLNPNIPMKDSGVEWIGKIPAHWEVRKIKYICQSEKFSVKTGPFGSQLKGQDLQPEGDVCVYNQRNVIDGQFEETQFFVSNNKAKTLTSFYTKPLDLLVTSRGTIGKCAILPKDRPIGILHPCLIALRINQHICDLIWAKIFINDSVCFATNIFLNSNSTTIEVIYTDTLKNIVIPIPPIQEQQKIITHIENETGKIDSQISKANRRIELLEELKQSIITEAVTGKIKVC